MRLHVSAHIGLIYNKRDVFDVNWFYYIQVKGKGRFIGLFNTAAVRPIVFLPPNKFPHSSPEAPHIIQMRETSTSEGGNYYQWILLANL